MDCGKEYIKMCYCPEIQGLRKGINGDVIYLRKQKRIAIEPDPLFIDSTWLPRQDQLQEMMKKESWIKTQVSFYDFIFETAGKLCATCFNGQNFTDGEDFYEKAIKLIKNEWDSFEQAWLAFVMKEKFSKKWNRKNWIKI